MESTQLYPEITIRFAGFGEGLFRAIFKARGSTRSASSPEFGRAVDLSGLGQSFGESKPFCPVVHRSPWRAHLTEPSIRLMLIGVDAPSRLWFASSLDRLVVVAVTSGCAAPTR